MRFHKLISPLALVLTVVVLFNCPAIIGQVFDPQQPRDSPIPEKLGNTQQPAYKSKQKPSGPYKLTSRFHVQKGTNTGYLIVKVEMPKGSYVYSTTQKEPLKPSKIQVVESNQFRIEGKFTPDRPATVVEHDPTFKQRLEKHIDSVQFFASIKIAAGVAPESLEADLKFSGQVCNERGFCVPIFGARTKAKFAGYFERAAVQRTGSHSKSSIGSQPR